MMRSNMQLRRARLAAATAVQAAGAVAANTDALAVTAVDLFPVQEPVSHRSYTVVRVRTRSGLTGYGECGSLSAEAVSKGRAIVMGKAASAYDVVSTQMSGLGGFRVAVNAALLDILGKHLKVPAYQVLGGPTRFKARAFTLLAGATDADLVESMKRAQAGGFRAFSVPVPPPVWRNQGQAYVVQIKKTLETLRAAGGEAVDFVLEGAGSLAPSDAASLCATLEGFHLLWFDEPCSSLNLSAMRKLARENVTPVGFGRAVSEVGGFQDLLHDDAVDIVRPNVAAWGISELRRIAVIAEVNYVAVAPYHDGGPIGTVAALHAAASMPNFFIQQIPAPAAAGDRTMREELAGAAAESIKEGFAVLPTGPGLGITVNEGALAKYKERAA